MKKEFKGFIIGVILTSMLMGSVVFADGVRKNIQVLFNDVNITVNGSKVNADNILYEGTTYVPLRAISEMLGKEVGWDASTKTASINDVTSEIIEESKPESESSNSGNETLAQKNAVKKAESYIRFSSFSKSGLIKQLEYEGFSKEDSIYAVNKINVDWNDQAYKKGKTYLDISSFSRDGLIRQLEFEGFTKEEVLYAVDKIGL